MFNNIAAGASVQPQPPKDPPAMAQRASDPDRVAVPDGVADQAGDDGTAGGMRHLQGSSASSNTIQNIIIGDRGKHTYILYIYIYMHMYIS